MAALTAPKASYYRTDKDALERKLNHPIAANAVIWRNGLLSLDASGNAAPMTAAVGLRCGGFAMANADATGLAAGVLDMEAEQCVGRVDNSAGADAITRGHVGDPCYGVDDQTVALTDGAGTRSRIGIICDVDNLGVWVWAGPIACAVARALP